MPDSRSVEEVFQSHLRNRSKGLVEEDIKQNYSEDIVLLTCQGIYQGHAGLREAAAVLRESLPDATYEYYNKLVDGEFAFLEWRATNHIVEVREGADSFVIRNGKIIAQSAHYKVHDCSGMRHS